MANRKQSVCFKNLEEALAGCSETYGHIDILSAGWPCQGNSIAGKREGLESDSSGLWSEVARCLRIFKPTWFLGENVPGILSVNGGKDFCRIISELQEIGYGVSWRIFDSQHFGVAQRRRRVYIVGYFGSPCPPEILFEPESSDRDIKADNEIRTVGLCLSTRDGERQDPSSENLVASVVTATDYRRTPLGQFGNEGNLVASTIQAKKDYWGGKCNQIAPKHNLGVNTIRCETGKCSEQKWEDGLIAHTIGTCQRGTSGRIWEETHIATIDTDGEGEAPRISDRMVSPRGTVIGNAVTVNVAEWIGRRIIKYEQSKALG